MTSKHRRPCRASRFWSIDREGLGDALLKLPFLRAIAPAYPGREIWWIATYQTSMAQEMSPFVGKLIARTIENAGLRSPLREVVRRLREFPELSWCSICEVASPACCWRGVF